MNYRGKMKMKDIKEIDKSSSVFSFAQCEIDKSRSSTNLLRTYLKVVREEESKVCENLMPNVEQSVLEVCFNTLRSSKLPCILL